MKKTIYFLLVLFIFLTAYAYALDTTAEEYIIKKHDTLWDISDTKLEDAFLWPKLWNVNPDIENPDFIYPGTKIIIPSREELMQMQMPPLRKAPRAFRPRTARSKSKTMSKFTFAPDREQKYIVNKNSLIASGWISDTYPSIGKITYSPMNRQIVATGDVVYITLDNGEAVPNQRFFVIKDVKIVKHPVTGERLGHQIKIAGIIEVTKNDNAMTMAKVIAAFEDVQVGDGLLPYQEIEPPRTSDAPRTPDVQGYIVESHKGSFLLDLGDIIFLDKGKDAGLKIGDMFTVISESPTKRPIGKIQIVSLQPSTSGAVLLQSKEEISIGSKWGQK